MRKATLFAAAAAVVFSTALPAEATVYRYVGTGYPVSICSFPATSNPTSDHIVTGSACQDVAPNSTVTVNITDDVFGQVGYTIRVDRHCQPSADPLNPNADDLNADCQAFGVVRGVPQHKCLNGQVTIPALAGPQGPAGARLSVFVDSPRDLVDTSGNLNSCGAKFGVEGTIQIS